MNTVEIVIAVIVLLIAVCSFVISFFQFREKGFLFNNAYIFASKAQRSKMDKKPHYRQSAVIFALIGVIFLLLAIEVLAKTGWLLYVELVAIVIAIVFAIVSSIIIERKKK